MRSTRLTYPDAMENLQARWRGNVDSRLLGDFGRGARSQVEHEDRSDDGQVPGCHFRRWRQRRINVAAAIFGSPPLRLAFFAVARIGLCLTTALRFLFGTAARETHHAAPTRWKRQQQGIGEDQEIYQKPVHNGIVRFPADTANRILNQQA
jgi:hypothetical protein